MAKLERRKPESNPTRIKFEKPIKPSNDTSRDFLPKGWGRGLIRPDGSRQK